jgi:hypothetical protein
MKDFDTTMRSAAKKINFAKKSFMAKGRDEQGFSFSSDRILSSIANFMDSGSTTKFALSDAIASGFAQTMKNFSNKQNFSASDLASVQDIDVADIAIASTIASHGLTYIAMERAMDSTGQNISFQGLKAVNSAAGYTAGSKVVDPRTALSPTIDISRNGAREDTSLSLAAANAAGKAIAVELDPAGPVIKGETKVSIVLTANIATAEPTLIGYDTGKTEPDSNGDIALVLTKGGFIDGVKVNVNTGKLVAASLADLSTYTLIVNRCHDRIAESDGTNTLKLKPYMESTELVATENRVILQSSVEVQAQMNKILRKNAQYGVNVDFGKRAIDQVVMLYTYFVDLNIVRELWNGVKGGAVEASIDLSGFSTAAYNSFASTKNDRLNKFTDALCSKFLTRTGQPVTALVVDEQAALMYSSDKESFVPDAAFLQRRDGFIGTYRNLPIVRNTYLNGKGSDATMGSVIGVFKSQDGVAAPVAVGDYLPPYSTLPAINANNPGELSQALFSQTATKCVVPEWAIRALNRLTARN